MLIAHTFCATEVLRTMSRSAAALVPNASVTRPGAARSTARMISWTRPAFSVKPMIPQVSQAPSQLPAASE